MKHTLNQSDIRYLKQAFRSATSEMLFYTFKSPIELLEASYCIMQLDEMMTTNYYLAQKLMKLMRQRWGWLKYSDSQYLHHLDHPVNVFLIEAARLIAARISEPYLLLLMPTLKKKSSDVYISSSYEDDLPLQEWILSDRYDFLIHVHETLEYSKEDAVLKALVLNEHQRIDTLSFDEARRLRSKHPLIPHIMSLMDEKIVFLRHGWSAGAALTRLIEGLRSGSAAAEGEEFNAGSQANEAIVEFLNYLESCDESTRDQILSAEKFDRFNSDEGDPQLISIGQHWLYLTRDPRENYHNVRYCVEMIAQRLKEILEIHPWLYETFPANRVEAGGYVSMLTQLQETQQRLKAELTHVKNHEFYGAMGDYQMFKQMMSQVCEYKLRSLLSPLLLRQLLECSMRDSNPEQPISSPIHVLNKFMVQYFSSQHELSLSFKNSLDRSLSDYLAKITAEQECESGRQLLSQGFFQPTRRRRRAEGPLADVYDRYVGS
jgi:hypothetical protein